MTRTDDEIVAHIAAIKDEDWMGTITSDLVIHLPYERAKPWLKEGTTAEQWGEPRPRDRDTLIGKIAEYMPFAWEKANNCRGLSAARSLDHMRAWLWMLGEDEAAHEIQTYTLYGKPHLAAICEKFGIDWKALDDMIWRNNEMEDELSAPRTASTLPWREAPAEAA